jgi:GNAT superfamily N-acetyltransferase
MKIYLRDYPHMIEAETRDGPNVTCEARILKAGEDWIVDDIGTYPAYRRQGHATAILRRIREIHGAPLLAFAIAPEAQGFWDAMTRCGIYDGEVPETLPDPFTKLREALTTEKYLCRCGAVPEYEYEPGALSIKCECCFLTFTAPDAEVRTVAIGWLNKTNENRTTPTDTPPPHQSVPPQSGRTPAETW